MSSTLECLQHITASATKLQNAIKHDVEPDDEINNNPVEKVQVRELPLRRQNEDITEELATLGIDQDMAKTWSIQYQKYANTLPNELQNLYLSLCQAFVNDHDQAKHWANVLYQQLPILYVDMCQIEKNDLKNLSYLHKTQDQTIKENSPELELVLKHPVDSEHKDIKARRRNEPFDPQIRKLFEKAWEHTTHPTSGDKRYLAERCGLELKQVSAWFANRRARRPKFVSQKAE